MSEWKKYKLGDVTTWSSGGTPSKAVDDFWRGDIPWISASSMSGNRYKTSNLKITKSGLVAGSRLAEKDTILLLVRGSILHQKIPVGIAEVDVAFNQDVKAIKPKPEFLDSWFLLFWFMSIEKQLLEMVESTGIGAGKLDTKLLQNLTIDIPPKSEREKITAFIKSIDDKLILNTQTNQTLESIAQAIFKSWFVDFEPVKARMAVLAEGGTREQAELAAMSAISGKSEIELAQMQKENFEHYSQLAETAALFPSAMGESELGEIPEGWEVKNIENILELAYGKSLGKTERINGNIPVYGSGGLTGWHNKHLVNGPGIIVGRKGTVGSIYWEKNNFFPIDTVFYVTPKDGIPLIYTYYLLQILGLENMNTDAAVPGLNRNNVYRLETIFSSIELINAFSKIAISLKNEFDLLLEQSNHLSKLRDSLLPKLLSGEIDLSEIHSEVA
jgi:type I restriction enzyme, S subunit